MIFFSSALPAHWHRHLELCSGFNFQFISFLTVRILASWSQKRMDFHRQKYCLYNFYFVKYETYGKMLSVHSMSLTGLYHNVFFYFQNFEFRFRCDATSRVWTILSSVFERKYHSCNRRLNWQIIQNHGRDFLYTFYAEGKSSEDWGEKLARIIIIIDLNYLYYYSHRNYLNFVNCMNYLIC